MDAVIAFTPGNCVSMAPCHLAKVVVAAAADRKQSDPLSALDRQN
jgi:hypothetical protein